MRENEVSDSRKELTSSVAMYYYIRGVEEFESTTMEEMQDIIYKQVTRPEMTDEDIQQVWEVYVYFSHKTERLRNITLRGLPDDKDGLPRLLAEWDGILEKYNYRFVVEIINGIKRSGKSINYMLNKFKQVDAKYTRVTGKSLYVCIRRAYRTQQLTEIPMDVDAMMRGKIKTKDARECYGDVVFYELKEVIEYNIEERKQLKEKYRNKKIRISEYNDYTTFHLRYLKGLALYTDLVLGNDWGNNYMTTTKRYTGVY